MPPDRRIPELGAAYRWSDSTEASFLQFNAGCAGYVKPLRGPPKFAGVLFEVTIYWHGREVRGHAGSIEQGKRWIARWIRAREAGRRWVRRPNTAPLPAKDVALQRLIGASRSEPRQVIMPRGPDFDLEAELPSLPVFEDFLSALNAQSQAYARHVRARP